MSIEFQHDPAGNRLDVSGSFTIYHALEAKAPLLAQQGAALDLSEVEEMDGAGLQLLLLARRDAGIRLVAASDAVTDTLRLAGLETLLEAQP
jgi:anti-anti-sigma factor